MKQKVVIKVSLNGTKSRSKALKIAVSVSGVESAALGAQDKSQIEVVGDIDAVKLTTQLRKNVGHAELVSVSAAGEKKEEERGGQIAAIGLALCGRGSLSLCV
ncbi:hypothetical protein GH714_029737 [Hevea brasiliensis]|uniref:HMA domain-containing protein n=1 Tax=Hevea brasiliensis TaxID=3981 RepID=A0A6A6K8A0_HEVBR|nr:hypothetical protein GH714_029737 [Hevea brasiliensis]